VAEETKNIKTTVYVDPEIKQFLPEYIENRKKDTAAILEMLKKNDFLNIKTLGHRMKGSGKLYCLEEVSKIGAKIETAANMSRNDEIEKLCQELLVYLDN